MGGGGVLSLCSNSHPIILVSRVCNYNIQRTVEINYMSKVEEAILTIFPEIQAKTTN
jgi:hypothetical protein